MDDKLVIIIIALSIILILISILFIRLKTRHKKLYQEKENDIIETNRLLLKKSENDLNLFFEFEAATEEMIKMNRKIWVSVREISEYIKDVKI